MMARTLASVTIHQHRPTPTNDPILAYLSRTAPGTQTNYGEMCERAAAARKVSETCPSCGGAGYRELTRGELERRSARIASTKDSFERQLLREELGTDSDCRVCNGVGYVEREVLRRGFDKFATTAWCGRCRGSGEVRNEDRQDECPRCLEYRERGAVVCGYIVPATVKETGCSRSGKPPQRIGIDDAAGDPWNAFEAQVEAHGRETRRFDAFRRANPTAAAALTILESDEGHRWAATKWGRLFALWPLTSAGKKLIRDGRARSRAGHGFTLRDTEVLASERNAEEATSTPNLRRRAWLAQADREARRLHDAAQAALAGAR